MNKVYLRNVADAIRLLNLGFTIYYNNIVVTSFADWRYKDIESAIDNGDIVTYTSMSRGEFCAYLESEAIRQHRLLCERNLDADVVVKNTEAVVDFINHVAIGFGLDLGLCCKDVTEPGWRTAKQKKRKER